MKFKIPTPVMPTEERMKFVAEEWWMNHKEINFLDWNQTLNKNTFDYRACILPAKLTGNILSLIDRYNKELFDNTVLMMDGLLTPALKEMGCENKFFIKLISRSPKDYLYDSDNFGKPKAVNHVWEALNAIISSMRCVEDLILLKQLESNAIIVRPYIDFHPRDEWRVFIKDKKVVGISQYYYNEVFDGLDEYIDHIEFDIHNFINNIIVPNVNLDNYIADVVMWKGELFLLELNPWGLSDPCLFTYDNMDGSIKIQNI